MVHEYCETAVSSFYLFKLIIGVGILANLIQFNRLQPSEKTVLDTLPGFSDPNSHDNGYYDQNVNNIFCKNEDLRMKNAKMVIIGGLNINAISNKTRCIKGIYTWLY